MNLHARIKRLARILCVTPTAKIGVERALRRKKLWWLVGCVEGDTPLPCTEWCSTAPEAVDAAEAWLSPELDRVEELP